MDYDQTTMPSAYDAGRGYAPAVLDFWLRTIATSIAHKHISDILDLGCGTGRYTAALAAHFRARVVGVLFCAVGARPFRCPIQPLTWCLSRWSSTTLRTRVGRLRNATVSYARRASCACARVSQIGPIPIRTCRFSQGRSSSWRPARRALPPSLKARGGGLVGPHPPAGSLPSGTRQCFGYPILGPISKVSAASWEVRGRKGRARAQEVAR